MSMARDFLRRYVEIVERHRWEISPELAADVEQLLAKAKARKAARRAAKQSHAEKQMSKAAAAYKAAGLAQDAKGKQTHDQ